MANTLSGLIPTIYAALDTVSREQVGYIPNVFRNASAEQAAVNQTITYPITPLATVGNITPGVNAPDTGDQSIGNDTMAITKARAVPVRWNGEEQRGALNAGWYNQVLRDQFEQGFRALANEIEADLAGLYVTGSRSVGAAGTVPFTTANDMTDLANALKMIKDNGAGTTDLKMILNSTAAAKLRGKQSGLFKVNEAGTDDLLRNGNIGRLEGFEIGESGQAKTHTKGTGTSYVINGSHAIGATTIAVKTGANTIIAGDTIALQNDPNLYVVKTALSGGNLVIQDPGLLVAHVDSETVTLSANSLQNFFFKKQAIHLITRAPLLPIGPDGKAMDMADDVLHVTDPFSGLTFQIAAYRQFRQLLYYIGIAWGVKNAKPAFTGILLG